jgi:MFS family permease
MSAESQERDVSPAADLENGVAESEKPHTEPRILSSAEEEFELGSLICGVAPSSLAFIIGRAVAGTGSSGILSGSIVLTVYIIPLRQRPVYQGVMGAVIMVSSIIGPLIGGAFTTRLTWRWYMLQSPLTC